MIRHMANRRMDMHGVVAVTKALADESRVRVLMALLGGELCLCQIVTFLGLAPSTVSKHMSILHGAGLVERRKEGKWHYYRLPGRDADPAVRECLRWLERALAGERVVVKDADALCCVREQDLEEAAACYRS
jgi:ArsR family transcriptional regulator